MAFSLLYVQRYTGLTGLILNLENLENLENRSFLQIVRETWNSQGIFYKCYPSQGKVRENKLFRQHVIFINSFIFINTAVRKVVALFFVSKFELYRFA